MHLERLGYDRRAGNRRRLVLWEYDRILGADAAAGRAAFAAVIGLLAQDRFNLIDSIDSKQAEVDALHAVRAAAVVDHRVPAAAGFFVDARELCCRATPGPVNGGGPPRAPRAG